jgi:ABC-type lipoprotein release transport system permease subunit
MLWTLAWRNLWRNRRRSVITAASVGFAVLAAVLMRSFQLGSYNNMIRNVVGQYTGYGQLHAQGFWKEQTLEKTFEWDPTSDPKGHFAPRVESFALVALGDQSRGAIVAGIDPQLEIKGLQLDQRIVAGRMLQANDRGVVLGQGLADLLKAQPGDSVVLLGQGYQSISATGLYPVLGIVQLGSPDLSKNLLFMPLAEAQWFYGLNNRLTTLVARSEQPVDTNQMLSGLTFAEPMEAMVWQELLPDLDQAIRFDSLGGKIFLGVLYLVILFGLFGTVLMMTHERTREFGVLIAIGMARRTLAAVTVIESVLLAAVGGVLGWLIVSPVVWWLKIHPLRLSGQLEQASLEYGFEPILPTSTDPTIGLWQMTIVVTMAVVCSVYAVWAVYRIQPVETLRG